MLKTSLAVALTLSVVAGPAHAQSLLDKVREGAENVVNQAGEALDSTVEMVKDDETPEATRARLDSVAQSSLDRLFSEEPSAHDLYEESAGYAVFDVRKLTLKVAGGYGRGVAVDKVTGQHTYMNMAIAGVGRSFGFGGFESQLVILFETEADLNRFIEEGYDATAEGGAMLGEDTKDMEARFTDGAAVFVLTKQGWKVSASATGTKYWKDTDLN